MDPEDFPGGGFELVGQFSDESESVPDATGDSRVMATTNYPASSEGEPYEGDDAADAVKRVKESQ
jgi:hypothetical protein